jgi:hypothetical protein
MSLIKWEMPSPWNFDKFCSFFSSVLFLHNNDTCLVFFVFEKITNNPIGILNGKVPMNFCLRKTEDDTDF